MAEQTSVTFLITINQDELVGLKIKDTSQTDQITNAIHELIESKTPKKVSMTGLDDSDEFICPVCKTYLAPIDADYAHEDIQYCSHCGQKLTWN